MNAEDGFGRCIREYFQKGQRMFSLIAVAAIVIGLMPGRQFPGLLRLVLVPQSLDHSKARQTPG